MNDEQYELLMIEGHKPEILLSYDETPGATATINSWINKGHDVKIITGRPFSAFEASREWLNEHGLEHVNLFCLNKYGRDNFIKGSTFSLELEDYYKMHFDYAVEDSLAAFKFDRPWNQECELPSQNYKRCFDWKMISEIVG